MYEMAAILKDEFRNFPIVKICKILGINRNSYYDYINGKTYVLSTEKERVKNEVKRVFEKHKRRYGWRRIQVELAAENLRVGRYQIRNRMKEQSLVAIQPKSFVPKTTTSHPHLRRSNNLLLEIENLPTAPNEVIVGDITYLPNKENGFGKWLYLATWLDLYSRRIVGWHLARQMTDDIVIKAMKQVIRQRQPSKGFIVHSDGGSQYSSKDFRALLKSHQYRQSMTRKDNHYDNSHAESLFSRFKAELLDDGIFYGFKDAHTRTFEYIEGYYNVIRRHSSINYMSPMEFEKQFLPAPKPCEE